MMIFRVLLKLGWKPFSFYFYFVATLFIHFNNFIFLPVSSVKPTGYISLLTHTYEYSLLNYRQRKNEITYTHSQP